MEPNQTHKPQVSNAPNRNDIQKRIPIENDSDTLEPFDDESEHREINANDPEDLKYWANEFEIDIDALKAAIVLNGNSVRKIKKFLSV